MVAGAAGALIDRAGRVEVALAGFKNRAAVLFNWAIGFLGRGRPQRAVTTQQVFARRVREEQAALISREAAAFRDPDG